MKKIIKENRKLKHLIDDVIWNKMDFINDALENDEYPFYINYVSVESEENSYNVMFDLCSYKHDGSYLLSFDLEGVICYTDQFIDIIECEIKLRGGRKDVQY